MQQGPARLYLFTPRAVDTADLVRSLDTMLAAADVAAVLLRLPEAGEVALIDHIKRIAPVVQSRDTALILDGHAELVARTGADGAHLTGVEALAAAVGGLKPDRIAGAGGLRTRHEAMLAGERGADYLMFGEPNGPRPAFGTILERLAWWSELFQVPSLGYAESLDEVTPLASAGADFIALGEFVFFDSRSPSAMIRDAADRLRRPEPVK